MLHLIMNKAQDTVNKAGDAKSSKISSKNDACSLFFYFIAKVPKNKILAKETINVIIKN